MTTDLVETQREQGTLTTVLRGDADETVQPGENLRQEARRLIDSGALGPASSYVRLLTYLVECSVNDRAPKEVEIAVEVFGRASGFDPTRNAIVRVYVHNLRRKLRAFYSQAADADAPYLVVPRGDYRVLLIGPRHSAAEPRSQERPALPQPGVATAREITPVPSGYWRVLKVVGAASLLASGILLGSTIASLRAPSDTHPVAASPAWAPLLDDDLPITIVVGDYYIFGERDDSGAVSRLVRDFRVNSSKDLNDLTLRDASVRERYQDLSLTYLPAGSAFALRDVLRVAHSTGKPIRVASMSELSAAALKNGHVVYLGYISALGLLEDFVFASSRLAVGYNYDELRDRATGELYTSEAGIPSTEGNYRDYGLVSTFPGPNGNQLLVVAGTRDAGLMQAAHVLSDPMFLGDVHSAVPGSAMPTAPAFELLYEVTGYGRTNLDAMLVHSAELSYREIWGGDLREAL